MWSYLGLLLVPAGAAVASRLDGFGRRSVYILIGVLLTLAIGMRYHVGCDWNYYLLAFVRAQNATSLAEALTMFSSPGYMLVNWLAARAGLSIAAVNTVCALILVSGLLIFCSSRPRPWLALLIAIPVLILLAGFSSTRQGTAIGLFLWALHFHLQGRRPVAIILLVLAAASFHASALLLIPLMLVMGRGIPRRRNAVLILAAAAGVGAAIFATNVPPFSVQLTWYPSSGGAWLRAIPTLGALVAYAFVRNRDDVPEQERSMLFWLAAFSFFYLPLGFASSTIMDRMGWYAVPFQMAALSRVSVISGSRMLCLALIMAPAGVSALLLVGWLTFGATSACLIPYRSHLANLELLTGANAARQYKYNGITDPWDLVGKRGTDQAGNVAVPNPGP